MRARMSAYDPKRTLKTRHISKESHKKGRDDQHNEYGRKLTRPCLTRRMVRFLFKFQANDIDTRSKVMLPLRDLSVGRLRLVDLVEGAAIFKVIRLRLGPPPEQRIVDGHELDVREASEIVGIGRLWV